MKRRKGRTPSPRFLWRPRQANGVPADPHIRERIHEATAKCDEPESIGPAVASYVELAHKVQTLRRAREIEDIRERRKTLPVQARVEDVRRRAKARHVDMSHELRVIERMHERGKPQAVDRLVKLEARLDGAPEVAERLARQEPQ